MEGLLIHAVLRELEKELPAQNLGLAFAKAPAAFAASKIAILAASLLAGGIGFALLRRLPPATGEATR